MNSSYLDLMIDKASLPELFYQQEIEKNALLLSAFKKKNNQIGWLRLVVVLITAIISFTLFSEGILAGYFVLATGIGLFLFAVAKDVTLSKKIKNTENLIHINKEELLFLQNDYYHRYDGLELSLQDHPYANDLDVFGKASLFQFINRCNSQQGQRLLAHNLLEPLSVATIEERQESIQELTPMNEWRQQLAAFGLQQSITLATQKRTEEWLHEKDNSFTASKWSVIIWVYTFLTVLSLFLTLLGYIPLAVFSPLFMIYFFTSGWFGKKARQVSVHLTHIVKEIETISEQIKWIEEKEFSAPLLKGWQQKIKVENKKAFTQINMLKILLGRFDLRSNIMVFFLVNSFSFWDVRQVRALNKWKIKNRDKVADWYQCIATFEVLNSLSTLRFNKPGWCFPHFVPEHLTFDSIGIGHPLIKEEIKVTADFSIEGAGKIAVVTGSNMAGKSTFLRSLGCNIILAQIGSPVSAKELTLSPVQLMSSMRIADNLAENTSTFYAELKKLKSIIEAVNQHLPLFILLDEILRGTNSLDRHTGSKALIKQLLKEKAVAVIATHDLDLATLNSDTEGLIENYHFDAQVDGEELYFDYKLKEGICTSLNASILMKKIGIQLS